VKKYALFFYCLKIGAITVPESLREFVLSGHLSSTETPFFAPSELKPIRGLSLLQQIPEQSAYVSVGADRAYTNAALANANSLIIFDRDLGVIFFNYINTILLIAAKNKEEYLKFRTSPTHWIKPLQECFELENNWTSKEIFLSQASDFWSRVHKLYKQQFDLFYERPGQSTHCQYGKNIISEADQGYLCEDGDGEVFENASILHHDSLFERAKRLASQVMIENLDISSAENTQKLVSRLRTKKIQIGILDTSNIFPVESLFQDPSQDLRDNVQKRYLSHSNLSLVFLKRIKPVLHPNGFVYTSKTIKTGSVDSIPTWMWQYDLCPFIPNAFDSNRHCEARQRRGNP
jgi:hypothetical protein